MVRVGIGKWLQNHMSWWEEYYAEDKEETAVMRDGPPMKTAEEWAVAVEKRELMWISGLAIEAFARKHNIDVMVYTSQTIERKAQWVKKHHIMCQTEKVGNSTQEVLKKAGLE